MVSRGGTAGQRRGISAPCEKRKSLRLLPRQTKGQTGIAARSPKTVYEPKARKNIEIRSQETSYSGLPFA
jgi:hypothetical protein